MNNLTDIITTIIIAKYRANIHMAYFNSKGQRGNRTTAIIPKTRRAVIHFELPDA